MNNREKETKLHNTTPLFWDALSKGLPIEGGFFIYIRYGRKIFNYVR